MTVCVHHTIADVVWSHPLLIVVLVGWSVLCLSVAVTATAFSGLITSHFKTRN